MNTPVCAFSAVLFFDIALKLDACSIRNTYINADLYDLPFFDELVEKAAHHPGRSTEMLHFIESAYCGRFLRSQPNAIAHVIHPISGSYADRGAEAAPCGGNQPSMFTIYSTSPGLRQFENSMNMSYY